MDWRTPLGLTHVIQKQQFQPGIRPNRCAKSMPMPAIRCRQVDPGPDNPLGAFAMRLAAGKGTYLIHGTNNPIAVGLAVTHGCIRMYPDDVEALFPLIPIGTPVRLVNVPVKVAWSTASCCSKRIRRSMPRARASSPTSINFRLLQAAVGDTTVAIHWDYAREVLKRPTASSPR